MANEQQQYEQHPKEQQDQHQPQHSQQQPFIDHPVDIYLGDNKFSTIAASTLIRFDRLAAKHPEWTHRVLHFKTDEAVVSHLLAWMRSQSSVDIPLHLKPCSSSPETTDEPDFPTTVRFYGAMLALSLATRLTGPEVRDALFGYLRMAPLSFEEFRLLINVCGKDAGLVNEALRTLRGFRKEGAMKGVWGVPEWKRICDYGAKKGIEVGAGDE